MGGQTPRFFGNDEWSRRWFLQSAFGVSRRDKRRGFLVLRPTSRRFSYSMCTVMILQLLPQYEEVKGDNDVRGFSPQNLMLYNKQTLAMTIKHTAVSPKLKSEYDYDKINIKVTKRMNTDKEFLVSLSVLMS